MGVAALAADDFVRRDFDDFCFFIVLGNFRAVRAPADNDDRAPGSAPSNSPAD